MMWRCGLTTVFRLESMMSNTDEDSVRTITLRGLGKTVRENTAHIKLNTLEGASISRL